MATIGQQLTAPETGWKRFDDIDYRFRYQGSGWSYQAPADVTPYNYGKTHHQTSTIGDKLVFRFSGTSLRVIARASATGRASRVKITIDGESNYYTEVMSSSVLQCLVFEKTGLTSGTHMVTIESTESGTVTFDAIDIDNVGELLPLSDKVGIVPESGWKRFDDRDSSLIYSGTWSKTTNSTSFGGTLVETSTLDSSLRFKFKGTKLRIIGAVNNSGSNIGSDNIEISIDGNKELMSCSSPSILYAAWLYEKTGLADGVHEVIITNKIASKKIWFDAIDIDSNGLLVVDTGTQLLTPATEWRRYDDRHANIKYTGTWNQVTTTGAFTNTQTWSATVGNKINFRFTGSKLRIIGIHSSGKSKNIPIKIDGITYTIDQYSETEKLAVVSFEKLDLVSGYHIAEIAVPGDGSFSLDAIDVGENDDITVDVGQALTVPENGWKRYDDRDAAIEYIGSWSKTTSTSANSSTMSESAAIDDSIRFNFKGTKIRIISATNTTGSSNIEIIIDGVKETFTNINPLVWQALVYEKINLTDGMHEVIVTNKSTGRIFFDAIDIDSTGRLFHTQEVLNISELEVGKRIRANYRVAVSNKPGVIDGIGKENGSFISTTPGNLPNGDFYLIMVSELNGKKQLVAERNIQNSISWDSLNNYSLVNGIDKGNVLFTYNKDNCYVNNRADLQIDGDVTFSGTYIINGAGNVIQCGASGESLVNNILYQFSVDSSGYLTLFHEYGAGTNATITGTKPKINFNEKVDITVTRDTVNKKYVVYINDVKTQELTYNNNPAKAASGNVQKYCIGQDQTSGVFIAGITAFNLSVDNFYVPDEEYEAYKAVKYDENRLFRLAPLSSEKANVTVRLMNGGISSTDKNNEWDQYIVSSDLNGTIIAGDRNVWNWNGMYSWTSTPIEGTTSRVIRGNTAAGTYTTIATTNTSAASSGYRPLVEIEIIDDRIRKLLVVSDENVVYNHNGVNWVQISKIPTNTNERIEFFRTNGLDVITESQLRQLSSFLPSGKARIAMLLIDK